MRRITLLLMLTATALLVASGVASWAVTKTCPPFPQKCTGTNGADVLKSTSQDNSMLGGGAMTPIPAL